MSVLTIEILRESFERLECNFGLAANTIIVNKAQYDNILEYQKYMQWLDKLPIRTRKQIILKDKIKRRLGTYTKRILP